jgi:hypothetical protein
VTARPSRVSASPPFHLHRLLDHFQFFIPINSAHCQKSNYTTMATTTSTQTTTYTGPLSSLPTTSPGLHFLKKYLPLIDILDQSQTSTHELSTLVKPGAPFTSNCSAAIPFEQVLGMLKMREGMLSFFTHGTEDIAAFDLEIEGGPGGGGGGRKVVCEVDSMCVCCSFS